MTFTPTDKGMGIAGFILWTITWLTHSHIDTIVKPLGIKNKNLVRRSRLWINTHKTLSFCMTELLNMIHSGTDAAGVMFAFGGTICNGIFIFIVNPFLCWRYR